MTVITASDFKTRFDRGQFSYGDAVPAVRDSDIDNSISDAVSFFNDSFYPSGDVAKQALLYLTAHFLQTDIDSENEDSRGAFAAESHGALSVSESLIVPDWAKQGTFALFITTSYGLRFLFLTKPYLDGHVITVGGSVAP